MIKRAKASLGATWDTYNHMVWNDSCKVSVQFACIDIDLWVTLQLYHAK